VFSTFSGVIFYILLAEPLAGAHVTLSFRGTLIENHWANG